MPASPSSKPVSVKQRRANRLNSQKSTGPRTAAGKRVVSLNAVTHGIFCKDLVMPGESQAEFDAFAALLLADLKPQDWAELSICEQYVEARWRIRRVRAAEHRVFVAFTNTGRWRRECGQPRMQEWILRKFPDLFRPPTPEEKAALDERYDTVGPPTVAHTLCDSATYPAGGQHESLGRSQQRLELSADRALRQLHRLRAERRKQAEEQEHSCPFVDVAEAEDAPHDDNDEPTPQNAPSNAPAQNKPISERPRAGADVAEGCEQRACDVEPVTPTKCKAPAVRRTESSLSPARGAGGGEGRDA